MQQTAKYIRTLSLLVAFLSCLTVFAQKEKTTFVEIKTSVGDIKIKLYNETPLHRDNFVSLVKSDFYKGLLFHRVIKDYIIQGGDPESKGAEANVLLGNGGTGYTLKAEFNDSLIHKKGALAAARQPDNVNPNKESNGSQFYFVEGRKYNETDLQNFQAQREQQMKTAIFQELLDTPGNEDLKKMIDGFYKVGNQRELNFTMQSIAPKVEEIYTQRGGFTYTDEQKKIYAEVGGTPNLDGSYTVFGEVTEGLDLIGKIAAVATDANNRPKEDIVIESMKIVKR